MNFRARLFFIVFFAVTGLLHHFITEYYFVRGPGWTQMVNEDFLTYAVGSTEALSLGIAFLLLFGRRSTDIYSAILALVLVVFALPAHLYSATGHLLFNDWPYSPILSGVYVALAAPAVVVLIWLLFGEGQSARA